MIKLNNLHKKFNGLNVLDKINLTIEKGDIFGLIGRSGAGKSTLLRCMNGLEKYENGSLTIYGEEINSLNGLELRLIRKKIGMIFQEFSLTERDTVYQNIALPMKCWKINKDVIDKKIDELLYIVGLSEKKYNKARELSGGQKQRVAIARALALEPEVLLCDEATSALDPNTTHSVLKLLKDINKNLGVTIVIVTHQMNVIREICKKVAILKNGTIADVGLVEDVFMNQSKALVELLGEESNIKLPTKGVNIKFLFSNRDNKELFSTILKDIEVDYDLITANVSQYVSGNMGQFIINIDKNDLPQMAEALHKKDMKWTILNE